MKLLIRSVKIFQPSSAIDQTTVDILIEDGMITRIGLLEELAGVKVLDAKGAWASIGWMDVRTNFCDPGFEQKETLHTGCLAAAHGGFTAVACYPETSPVADNKSIIEYIRKLAKDETVSVYPVGSITKGMEGKELAELYDMYLSGAIGFVDGSRGTEPAGLLLRALQYSKTFDAVIISSPDDRSISGSGRMHEGIVNVGLGLKGIPVIAETIALKRDIDLLRYTRGRLHVSKVSTADSVELNREAKAEGLSITADVTIHHLCHTDEDLAGFDSNFKLFPPLRSKDHVDALITGLTDGTLDAIVSDHTPENIENKDVEFEYAASGSIGVQQLFSMYCMNLQDKLPMKDFIKAITLGPRNIFHIDIPRFEEGQKAELTFFNPTLNWDFNEETSASLSQNSFWFGSKMQGKAIGIVNGEKFLWF